MSGAEDGKVLKFDMTPIVLGRNQDDDVCLPFDTRVSRHHARITKEKGTYFIEDTGPEGKGSTNHTYIVDLDKGIDKGMEVTTKTRLLSGAILKLGTILLKFEYKDDK